MSDFGSLAEVEARLRYARTSPSRHIPFSVISGHWDESLLLNKARQDVGQTTRQPLRMPQSATVRAQGSLITSRWPRLSAGQKIEREAEDQVDGKELQAL